MSHLCTHSELQARPEAGTLEMHLKSTDPLNCAIADVLMRHVSEKGALASIPHIKLNVEANGVIREFLLTGHVQDWFESGEVPVITMQWRLASDVRRG